MEQGDGEMKGGGRRKESGGGGGGGESEGEGRSCQAVYPCHSSQESAMDKWITAISDCQEKKLTQI